MLFGQVGRGLVGEVGNDALKGGGDTVTDQIVFNAITESVVGVARDKAFQFVSGVDDFDLRTMDANSALAGDQAFTFSGATAKVNAV